MNLSSFVVGISETIRPTTDSCTGKRLLLTIPYEAPLPHVTVPLARNQTMDRNPVLLSRSALSSPGEESVLTLNVHLRLVVQVFRQYEKRDRIPRH